MEEIDFNCDQLLQKLNIKLTNKDEYKRGYAFANIILSVLNKESEEFIQGVIDSFQEGF